MNIWKRLKAWLNQPIHQDAGCTCKVAVVFSDKDTNCFVCGGRLQDWRRA